MNQKARILIVDDDPTMRELTLVALEPDPVATAVAALAPQGLRGTA
jgi:CheY-like chemotaxis protein